MFILIFVTVGSRNYPFDRLFKKLDMLYEEGVINDSMFAQIGTATYQPKHYEYKSFISQDEFIERMPDKYNTHIEQGGANVSGGQKQRLCIARALLKNPKILILDDSTSAVDTVTDAKIRKAFREEIPDTTKIIIAQRISSVQDADRIIVMDDGKINEIGTHDYLKDNNEIYREVYLQQTNDNGDFDKNGGEM